MRHRRDAMLTSVALALVVLAAACSAEPTATPAPTPTPGPTATPTPVPDYVSELVFAVERGSTEALIDPLIVPASEADDQFDPREPVLVAEVNGEQRAYSLIQMGIHEVVNDVIGGVPVAVTW